MHYASRLLAILYYRLSKFFTISYRGQGGGTEIFFREIPPLSLNEQSKYRRLEHQLPSPTYELLVSSSSVLIAAIDHC